METTEQKVAKTVLQQPEEVIIGKKTFRVAQPSVATLILASEAISRLPKAKLDSEKIVEESLSIARDCKAIGDIIATFIIGANKGRKSGISALIHDIRKRRLAKMLLEEMTPSELHLLLARLLTRLQIGDFFGLTTFLLEINLIRPTKVVSETTTTASGR